MFSMTSAKQEPSPAFFSGSKKKEKETSMFLGYQNINVPRSSKQEQTRLLNEFIEQLMPIVPQLHLKKLTSGVLINIYNTPLTINKTYEDGISRVKLCYEEIELACMERQAFCFDAYVIYRFNTKALEQLSQRLNIAKEEPEKNSPSTPSL